MSKFYITTAIPYVNAELHIGNVLDQVQADALARYYRQQGAEVLFSVGTDEHGTKIAEAAAKQGLEPQVFTNQANEGVANLFGRLNISYDRFVRTTSDEHKRAAREMWQRLSKDIYKSQYSGLYCVGCEEYVTEEEAKANNNVCPDHERPYEVIEEENYFFALSRYTGEIKRLITADEYRVVPESRKHEILSLLESGLRDVSFSRPKDKLNWGVEVPGDPEHVMYVWPDALTNYLTATGFPEEGYEKWWPADAHVIGKGILRFHAAIWPGMLLAAGLPLPKNLFVHDYITINGQKISKSLNNVVRPLEIIDKYGTDAFRYYLLHEIPSTSDGDFTWERLEAVYNSELADDLGNLVSRVTAMINKYQGGLIGLRPSPAHDIARYHEAMTSFRFDKALDELSVFTKDLNLYIEEEKPWQVAKTDPEHLQEILAYLAVNIEHLARFLFPFMPDTAQIIANTFHGKQVKPMDGTLFPKNDSPQSDKNQ